MSRTSELFLIATLFGILFLASVDNQLLIPLLPVLSRDLGVPVESLGRLFSLYALSAALFNLIVGPLTDRLGRVPFLRLGLLLFAALALATYLSRGYAQLAALRTAAGLAAAILSTCTASFIGDYFPYHQRGRIMGIVLSAYFAALIVGIPAGAWIAERWHWRAVFLTTFGVAGLLFLRSVAFLPVEVRHRGVAASTVFGAYPELLKKKATLGGLAASFCISGATLSFLTFISAHLDHRFGATPIQISSLFLIAGVSAIAGSPLSGWLSDRLGKRKVFLAANTLLALPLLLLPVTPWGSLLVSVFLAISLLVASRQTALQTIQTELVSSRERGAYLGLRNGFSQLGISIAVGVAGSLYSSGGYAAVAMFAAVLTVVGSAVFYLTVPEPDRGGDEPPVAEAGTPMGSREGRAHPVRRAVEGPAPDSDRGSTT